MKKVIFLALLMPASAFCQTVYDFEHNDITEWTQSTPGHWASEAAGAISGNFSLHHIYDNPANGNDCVGVKTNNLHPEEGTVKWVFKIRYGYDPSSSNNWSVMLMSDTDPASLAAGEPFNGFAIGVNQLGYDDTLRLWKYSDGIPKIIVTVPVNWQNDIGISKTVVFNITRLISGHWEIIGSDKDDNELFNASGYENDLWNPAWFILNYKYTSTRDRLLWFDDLKIAGVFYNDIEPPVIKSLKVTGRKSLKLSLNEEPSTDFILTENFILNDIEKPKSVKKITGLIYELFFETCLKNKETNNLHISGMCDRNNNCSSDSLIYFTPSWAEPGDIVINEIMVDPLPVVGLPAKEYIELFNRTGFDIDISRFNLIVDDDNFSVPALTIKKQDYLILCSLSDTSLFSPFGQTAGMKPFPLLSDDGKLVVLNDSTGSIINGIEYSKKLYCNALKSTGGWSLELIDSAFPFFSDGNWSASTSRYGGTPGKENSVSGSNTDTEFYGITNVFPTDEKTVSLTLSEPFIGFAGLIDDFSILSSHIDSAIPNDPLLRNFILVLSDSLDKGKIYTLNISDRIKDFAKNTPVKKSFLFGMPEPAIAGDLSFNELLFNPLQNEQDFIEFYNNSGKTINPASLFLASINEEGDTSELLLLYQQDMCILPGSYYTVTIDKESLVNRYPESNSENIYESEKLPSMPDARGHLLLLNRKLDLIDEVIYNEKMHYPLLNTYEGISLEKVRPDIPSCSTQAWHSASESSGWGTPGKENSVISVSASTYDIVNLSSGRISPDNDGFEDVLIIDLNLVGLGNVVTIKIFNETGGFVRKICENYLAAENTSFVWDGSDDDEVIVRTGIYVIFIELYTSEGKTLTWKKVCTVVRN